MKVLICSDSHGRESLLCEITDKEKPDAVWFLGDGINDFDYTVIPQNAAFCKDCGNCDFTADPEELCFSLEKKRFLLTHGHKYSVKQGLFRISLAAREKCADIVFYGHTHHQCSEEYDGILFACPGAVCNGKYAVLNIRNGEYSLNLLSL